MISIYAHVPCYCGMELLIWDDTIAPNKLHIWCCNWYSWIFLFYFLWITICLFLLCTYVSLTWFKTCIEEHHIQTMHHFMQADTTRYRLSSWAGATKIHMRNRVLNLKIVHFYLELHDVCCLISKYQRKQTFISRILAINCYSENVHNIQTTKTECSKYQSIVILKFQ